LALKILINIMRYNNYQQIWKLIATGFILKALISNDVICNCPILRIMQALWIIYCQEVTCLLKHVWSDEVYMDWYTLLPIYQL